MRPTHKTLAEKLLACSSIVGECRLWSKARSAKGYGVLTHERVSYRAHRAAYSVFKGPIPFGLSVLHTCDVRHCINPEHLYAGTDADNGRDKAQRGRVAPKHGELNGNSKLKESDVLEIKRLRLLGHSLHELRVQFNVSRSCIKHIIAGRAWTHCG